MPAISHRQFGKLFHGTTVPGLTEIDQRQGQINSGGMSGVRGYNFATTDLDTAIFYARSNRDRQRGSSPAVVYEVSPKFKSYGWMPDPHSGPNGWNDGPRTKREALDNHDGGVEVSLKFESPLKAKEILVEDRATDITPSWDGTYMGKSRSFT